MKCSHKKNPIIIIKIYDLEDAFWYKQALTLLKQKYTIDSKIIDKTYKVLTNIVKDDIIDC
jgi:hypothetical protein